jgi:hypothetical protein
VSVCGPGVMLMVDVLLLYATVHCVMVLWSLQSITVLYVKYCLKNLLFMEKCCS